MVARYLLYLLPLVAVELFPATMLVAVLITYALLAREKRSHRLVGLGSECLPANDARLAVCGGDWSGHVAGAGARDAFSECKAGGSQNSNQRRPAAGNNRKLVVSGWRQLKTGDSTHMSLMNSPAH